MQWPLAPEIAVSHSLMECNLRDNELGKEGLVPSLTRCATTREQDHQVGSEQTAIDTEVAKSLASYMSVSHSLSSINLNYNYIGSEAQSARACHPSATPCQVSISTRTILVQGAKVLAPAIRDSHSLTVADLGSNHLARSQPPQPVNMHEKKISLCGITPDQPLRPQRSWKANGACSAIL